MFILLHSTYSETLRNIAHALATPKEASEMKEQALTETSLHGRNLSARSYSLSFILPLKGGCLDSEIAGLFPQASATSIVLSYFLYIMFRGRDQLVNPIRD